MRTCTLEGCNRKHVAKGLCSGHYNRTRYSSEQRHPKVATECACCGTVIMKMADKRYKRFCSLDCRDFYRWGPASCLLTDKPKPRRPATPKPPPFTPHERACGWCGSPFTATSRRHSLCSEGCSAKAKRMRRRGRQSDVGGTYTWAEVMRLYLAFDRCCAYCEQRIQGQPDPDHVVPLSRGGSNSLTNILPSCRACNSDKRDLLLSEWNADRQRRGLEPRIVSWSASDRRVVHMTASVAA